MVEIIELGLSKGLVEVGRSASWVVCREKVSRVIDKMLINGITAEHVQHTRIVGEELSATGKISRNQSNLDTGPPDRSLVVWIFVLKNRSNVTCKRTSK